MKDIDLFEWLYAVYTDGKVWSHISRKFLTLNKQKKWYVSVTLCKDNKKSIKRVHQLVAQAFIPNPENKPIAHHINHITNDNRVENLMWYTPQDNVKEWWEFWRVTSEKSRQKSRENWLKTWKKIMQLTKEWILCRIYRSCHEAGGITWLSYKNINTCALWKTKRRICWWYFWQYVTV